MTQQQLEKQGLKLVDQLESVLMQLEFKAVSLGNLEFIRRGIESQVEAVQPDDQIKEDFHE